MIRYQSGATVLIVVLWILLSSSKLVWVLRYSRRRSSGCSRGPKGDFDIHVCGHISTLVSKTTH